MHACFSFRDTWNERGIMTQRLSPVHDYGSQRDTSRPEGPGWVMWPEDKRVTLIWFLISICSMFMFVFMCGDWKREREDSKVHWLSVMSLALHKKTSNEQKSLPNNVQNLQFVNQFKCPYCQIYWLAKINEFILILSFSHSIHKKRCNSSFGVFTNKMSLSVSVIQTQNWLVQWKDMFV